MTNTKESLPSQEFLSIESVNDGIIRLKTGGLRKILLVSGLNFSLKSEEEQGLITYAFQSFLNSLNFTIQIFIHSRKLNIEEYLMKLQERETAETNQLLKNQITDYREFIKAFVTQNAIMQKSFFISVPFDSIQLPPSGNSMLSSVRNIFGKSTDSGKTQTIDNEIMEQLNQRVDRIIGGLNQIGHRAIPLNTDEIKELFYNLYNPAKKKKKNVTFGQPQ